MFIIKCCSFNNRSLNFSSSILPRVIVIFIDVSLLFYLFLLLLFLLSPSQGPFIGPSPNSLNLARPIEPSLTWSKWGLTNLLPREAQPACFSLHGPSFSLPELSILRGIHWFVEAAPLKFALDQPMLFPFHFPWAHQMVTVFKPPFNSPKLIYLSLLMVYIYCVFCLMNQGNKNPRS